MMPRSAGALAGDATGGILFAKKKKRKMSPAPSRPAERKKVSRAAAQPRKKPHSRSAGFDVRAEQMLGGWFGRFAGSVDGGRDLFRLIIIVAASLVILLYSFSAGGYFVVRRSYGELVILYLIILGLLFRLQTTGRMPRLGKIQMALFGGFVAWIALSISWSIIPARTLDEFVRGLLYLAGFAVVYIFLRRRAWLTWLGHMFIIITAIVAIAALRTKVFPDPAPYDFDARLSWPLTYWNTVAMMMVMAFPIALRVVTDRASNIILRCAYSVGLFLFAATLFFTFSRAGLIFYVLALAIYLLLSVNRLRALLQTAIVWLWTLALIGICYVWLPAMRELNPAADVRTSQGHMLGLAIALMALAVVGSQLALWAVEKRVSFSRERIRQIGYGLAAAGIAAAVIGGGIFLIKQGGPVAFARTQIDSFTDTTRQAASVNAEDRLFNLETQRPQEYGVSLDTFKSHPLTGTGAATWSVAWLQNRPAYTDPNTGKIYDMPVKNGHSLFFDTLAELGLPGGLLLVGFIVTFIIASVRDLRFLGASRHREIYGAFFAASIALLLHAQMDWDWQMSVIFLALFMFIGGMMRYGVLCRQSVAAGASGAAESAAVEAPVEGSRSLPRFLHWNWLVGIGCGLAMVVTVFPLLGAVKLQSANEIASQAAGMAQQAQSKPGSVSQAQIQAKYADLQSEADQAHFFNPLEGEAVQLQALAVQGLGGPDGNARAEQLMQKALDIEPQNYMFVNNLARIYIATNQVDKAVDALKLSRQLNPLESKQTADLESTVRKMGGALWIQK